MFFNILVQVLVAYDNVQYTANAMYACKNALILLTGIDGFPALPENFWKGYNYFKYFYFVLFTFLYILCKFLNGWLT